MDQLNEAHYFTSPVYMVKKTEFLGAVQSCSDRHLEIARKAGNVTTMTGNFSLDPEVSDFAQYVSQTAWNILASQGYMMSKLVTYFTEMWTQEHGTQSVMDTHVHGMGAQISAFYFLDVPDQGCNLVIHDPRPGKVIVSLPAEDDSKITAASPMVMFTPEPGVLIFTNSWLPHSFTRNQSDKPMRFVHMNLSVAIQETPEPQVEVV